MARLRSVEVSSRGMGSRPARVATGVVIEGRVSEISMSASYGVRLTDSGPNRLAVMVMVRPLLGRPPAEVKAAIDGGEIVLLAMDVSRTEAVELAEGLRRLGASVEIFVSDQCPSLYYGNRADAWLAIQAERPSAISSDIDVKGSR